MRFKDYLSKQLGLHPAMQPQDIVKMCYQAAFGAEHLLSDMTAAKSYFEQEYDSVLPREDPLYESISDHICRISLPAWKASGMPAEWLFRIFISSAKSTGCGQDTFLSYLQDASELLTQTETTFSLEDWYTYRDTYLEKGITAVHHSQHYRDREHPAYRIVKSEFIRILPILKKAALLENTSQADTAPRTRIIAIDGRAASGKTTIAGLLSSALDTDIVHMDDFFLPPALRCETRLQEPGGNVHYERFAKEVLPFAAAPSAFSYTIFDCSCMDYNGCQTIKASPWRIIEGSYSHHPHFCNYADIKVYSHVEPDEQMRRILLRNGEWLAEKFRTTWIPMEENYFSHFHICEQADIVLINKPEVI